MVCRICCTGPHARDSVDNLNYRHPIQRVAIQNGTNNHDPLERSDSRPSAHQQSSGVLDSFRESSEQQGRAVAEHYEGANSHTSLELQTGLGHSVVQDQASFSEEEEQVSASATTQELRDPIILQKLVVGQEDLPHIHHAMLDPSNPLSFPSQENMHINDGVNFPKISNDTNVQATSSDSSTHLKDLAIGQCLRPTDFSSNSTVRSSEGVHRYVSLSSVDIRENVLLCISQQDLALEIATVGVPTSRQNARNVCGLHHVGGRDLSVFDGPSDRLLVPASSNLARPSISSRRSSVAENFDEAADVWGKALRAHQDGRRPSSSGRRSTSAAASQSSQRRPSREFNDEGVDLLCDPSGAPRIVLNPINADHSFDRLAVPGRGSISQPHSLRLSMQHFRRDSATASPDGRQRSKSQPEQEDTTEHPIGLTPPGTKPTATEVPQTFVTEPQPTTPDHDDSARSELHSSLEVWSRYPSHTRTERNESAGSLDNVIARDFATSVTDSKDLLPTRKGSGQVQKQKSKAKTQKFVWMVKSLPGWPSRVISRNSGFRQRESGHRSSIAAGGVLEYPELELLPGAEATITPEWNEASPFSENANGRRSHSHNEGSIISSQRAGSVLGSSNYDTPIGSRSTSSDPGTTPPVGGWVAYYEEVFSRPERRPTDLVSPLDGHVDSPVNLLI